MHKLFIGNLSPVATVKDLAQLLADFELHYIGIQFKEKIACAFVDFPDQNAADKAIDCLNGYNWLGVSLKLEPTLPRKQGYQSQCVEKVLFRDLPGSINWSTFVQLLDAYGSVLDIQRVESVCGSDHQAVYVTYSTHDEAARAVDQLDNAQHQHINLKVSLCSTNHHVGDGHHHQSVTTSKSKMSTVHHQTQPQQQHQMHQQQRIPRHQTTAQPQQYHQTAMPTMQQPHQSTHARQTRITSTGAPAAGMGAAGDASSNAHHAQPGQHQSFQSAHLRTAQTGGQAHSQMAHYQHPTTNSAAHTTHFTQMHPSTTGGIASNSTTQQLQAALPDFPLRMVVDSRFVGAIIGQGGANIREITKESKARCVVDVQRGVREQTGGTDKVINIYGIAENCSKACIKILEVVNRELAKENPGENVEPELKLRAHNQLVGRLIGKNGASIKKIMDETGCTVFVSNISELSTYSAERTITIRGTMDKIAAAEAVISGKLRQCWEQDMNNAQRQAMYAGAGHLMAPTAGGVGVSVPLGAGALAGYQAVNAADPTGALNAYAPLPVMTPGYMHPGTGMSASGHLGVQMAASSHGRAGGNGPVKQMPTETVTVWVPNNIVGALIGTKGVHIRGIMRQTGATIRIEAGRQGENGHVGGASAVSSNSNANSSTSASSANTTGGNQDATKSPSHENVTDKDDENTAAGGADKSSSKENIQQQQNGENADERRVTIIGNEVQQNKAQLWVYSRVCEHAYSFFDEVTLYTETSVPSKLVGRIIGKGGQNVRELQRLTHAVVKIPEDPSTTGEETVVRIHGNFQASQLVQNRIRQLVYQFSSLPSHD